MMPTFDQIEDTATRHQWANYILTNCMSVNFHQRAEGIYLGKYITWLRSMSNTQECLDLLDHALHDKGSEDAKD